VLCFAESDKLWCTVCTALMEYQASAAQYATDHISQALSVAQRSRLLI